MMRFLKSLLFLSLVFGTLIGCGPIYNSNYSDEEKFNSKVTGSEAFIAAQTVIRNKCVSCHSAWGNWNEGNYLASGKIVANRPADSILYTKIKGNDSGITGNMPPSESLSSEEYLSIRNWILAI